MSTESGIEDACAMYDPIPWHLDEIEATRRGLAHAGWYLMGDRGEPVAGPHEDPEGCVMEMSDRARAEVLRAA